MRDKLNAALFGLCFIACCQSVWAEYGETHSALTREPIYIAIDGGTFEAHIGDRKQNLCATPYEFSEIGGRILVELVIICLALAEAEFTGVVYSKPVPNYVRALEYVASGKAHTMAESIWSGDADYKHVRKTRSVIRENEFEKGLYTRKDHPLRSAKITTNGLIAYTGITQPTWYYDWQILQKLTLSVVPAYSTTSIFRMLVNGRADFSILEFPSGDDLMIQHRGIELYAIEGVKVVLPDSRVFVVSRKAPGADYLYKAINIGIEKLRSKGEISRMYQMLGFFNKTVKDWKVLNFQDVFIGD